jgi:hypothetical protein
MNISKEEFLLMVMFYFTNEVGLHCFTEKQTELASNVFKKWLKMNSLTGEERVYTIENMECKIRQIINEIEQSIVEMNV